MITKYGAEINNNTMADYFEMLIGKIFKVLPLYEESCETLDSYLFSLLKELCGGKRLILENKVFIELINNLESLSLIESHKEFKAQIFKCTNLCKKISNDLKGGV
jgi:hypothetical protein